jgi:hypothetical protein
LKKVGDEMEIYVEVGAEREYNKKKILNKLEEDLVEPKIPTYDITDKQISQIVNILKEYRMKGDMLNLDLKKGELDYLNPFGNSISIRDGKLIKNIYDSDYLRGKLDKILDIK